MTGWSYWDWSAALRDIGVVTLALLALFWTGVELVERLWP